ncbi:MAG: tetratricopeptide repeat protein, partial [Anaerolineae bacterium]|nr:tetratricopeptide repeat protein [Anaerolineae bacterium]
LDTPIIFVLDDYHVITLPAIHEALTFLLDHLPPQMHLVITSRADLPLSLSRLRVRRQLTEIRATDLRFTESEAAAFLNQTMGLNLTTEAIATLETRTEGWVAGLQLAALSMENLEEAHRHNFIATLTEGDRYILDYLIEEVLDRQPAHIQSFLLHTSILERLSGPLCDAVLSEGAVERRGKGKDYFPPAPLPPRPSAPSYPRPPASGQTMLEYLEHNNLFVVPLDNRRQWYRYHHLFADLLHNQLEASQPELEHTLHRRASAWYEQNDLMSEAIAHSLAAQDVEQAARLTEQTFDDMMSRDEFFTTMLERLEALPDEIIRARPRLGILYAWMLSITLQLDGVEPRLQEVERLAGDQLPTDLRLQITHIRAELARYRQDVTEAIALSHQVLEALPEEPSGTDRQTLTGTIFNLAFAYLMMGDVVKAQQRFSEALTLSRTVGSITLTLVAMTGQAQVQVLQGHLQQAAKTYRQALQLADEVAQQSGRAVPATAYVHLGMGGLLCERNNLDEAARHLAQGLELAQQWQIDEALRDGYIFQARLKQAQGDMAGALEAVGQAEQLPLVCQAISGYGGPVAAFRARLMLAHVSSSGGTADPGYFNAVEQWAAARSLSAEVPINLMDDEFEILTWVRLLIIQDEPDQVLPLLARLLKAAGDGGRTGRVIEILNLQALAQSKIPAR